jgi:hypothetical protein
MVIAREKPIHADNSSDHETRTDDSDADAFAVLSLLVIAAAAFVYFLNHH